MHAHRYWPDAGPQLTLYVPGPVLREGTNEIVLLEIEGAPQQPKVSFVDEPRYVTAHRQRRSQPVQRQPDAAPHFDVA